MSEATQCTQNVHEEPSEFLTKQVTVGARQKGKTVASR